MNGNANRHSRFCLIPPHILHEIAHRGSPEQRRFALDTLGADHSFRSNRQAFQLLAKGARKFLAPAVPTAEASITIYDAHHRTRLPGKVIGNPDGGKDVEAKEAHDGLLATFNFYWEVFKRDSIDGRGLPLIGSVHYSKKYDNAFWNGQQMVFGDGDGQIFRRFTIAIDIMGHELTHGVTGDTANLDYQGQSGALNESVSDVFGSMIKQYAAATKQTVDKADWLIGAGIFEPSIKGQALRSMKNPGTAYEDPTLGKDPQPADMSGYVETDQDNGGVHINSGIPNRAFYLTAEGFGGDTYSWDKAGPIWYASLLDQNLRPSAAFSDFAKVTIANASKLYGAGAAQVVTTAWQTVKVL